MIIDYVKILRTNYPNVGFNCIGDASVYANLTWVSGDSIPSQETLDGCRLEICKSIVREKVNEYRKEWLFDYFTYDDKHWDCNKDGRDNISGLNLISVLNGGNLPPGITFRDHDNVNWPATAAYMGGMAGALLTFTNSGYVVSWNHKAAIDALTTIEEVLAYDITTGWPAK